MICEKCDTDSLIQQDHKDPITQKRSNFWWCTNCSKRSKPAPIVSGKSEMGYNDDETDWIELPKGFQDD